MKAPIIFNWGNPWIKWVILAFVAVFAFGIYREARGAEISVEFELGTPQANSCCKGAYGYAGILVDDKWQFGVGALTNEHHSGKGEVESYLYVNASRLVAFRRDKLVRPYLGLGFAFLPAGANAVVTLPITFHLQTGVRVGNWYARWQHMSNAGLNADTNPGQDVFGIGYQVRF